MFKVLVIGPWTTSGEIVAMGKSILTIAEEQFEAESTKLYGEADILRSEITAAIEGYEALLAKMEREHEAEVTDKEAGIKEARIEARGASERAATVSSAVKML